MDWFRSHHGAPTDPKWMTIARRAKVIPGMVVSVWWALLDHASQASDRGSINGFDPESLADFYGYEQHEVEAIISALKDKGLITDDRIAAWEKRQPKREREDDSRERVAEHRKRKAAEAEAAEKAAKQANSSGKKPPNNDKPPKNGSSNAQKRTETPDEAQDDLLTLCNDIENHVTPCNAQSREEDNVIPLASANGRISAIAGAIAGINAEGEKQQDPNPATVVYRQGLRWLMENTGKPEQALRQIIGKWRKVHRDGPVLAALSEAMTKPAAPSDPIAFITKCLNQKPANGDNNAGYARTSNSDQFERRSHLSESYDDPRWERSGWLEARTAGSH